MNNSYSNRISSLSQAPKRTAPYPNNPNGHANRAAVGMAVAHPGNQSAPNSSNTNGHANSAPAALPLAQLANQPPNSQPTNQSASIMMIYPLIRPGDRVYFDNTLLQSDLPSPGQKLRGKSTWRVFGHLIGWCHVVTKDFTDATGIPFKKAKEEKKNPYDFPILNRLRQMFDLGRLPGIANRSYLDNGISLMVSIKKSWAHHDYAALMRDPGKYLSAIRFLFGPQCVNNQEIFEKVDELMSEAGLVLVSPGNLPPA